MPIKKRLIAALLTMFASFACFSEVDAASVKAASAKVSADVTGDARLEPKFLGEFGGIEEYQLANGLQILLFPDPTSTSTTVNITYRVGSRDEGPEEYGVAHILEHLLFKGTQGHPDIVDAMGQRGVGFNGTTSVDRTNYFASFSANSDTLDFLLGLEADRMVNSRIAPSDLEAERIVIRNELERSADIPSSVLRQRVMETAFSWHPYGRAVIGTVAGIEQMSVVRVQSFYKKYYRPDNATLLVGGAFDKNSTLVKIARLFGPISVSNEAVTHDITAEPPQDGDRSVTVRRVGGQPLLRVSYHVPALSHPDTAALIIYGHLMSVFPSGRLYRHLVEKGMVVSAELGGAGSADPGTSNAVAELAPGMDIDVVERELLALIEGGHGETFYETELARARDIAINELRHHLQSPQSSIQRISDVLAAGHWRLTFQLLEDLRKVTLADVLRVQSTYFRPANRTVGRYLPSPAFERVQIPKTPLLTDRAAGMNPPPQVEVGELLEPKPLILAKRMSRSTLKSGIELYTLRRQTRGNVVQARLQLAWGDHDSTAKWRGADILGALLSEGSEKRSKQMVLDTLIQLNAGFDVSSGPQGVTVYVGAERDTLLPALALVAELMRHPLLPKDAFERDRQGTLTFLEARRQQLETIRRDATRDHFNRALGLKPGDSDYLGSTDENLLRVRLVTIEDLRRFHAKYWSADEMRVIVVGAVPDGLAEKVEHLFGDWKLPDHPKFVRHRPVHVDVPAARFDTVVVDKADALMQMEAGLPISLSDAEYPAMQMAMIIFGTGGLESRLSQRIRVREGLSYGIQTKLDADFFGNRGAFTIRTSFAPGARDRVIAAVQEEIQRMSDNGVTPAELMRAKYQIAEGRRNGRSNLRTLCGLINSLAERDLNWAQVQIEDEETDNISVEMVNAAWRKYVRPDGFVTSTAGSFK